MDAYEIIEQMIAEKFGKETTTRKAVGDFMLTDDHAVNVKSNNVEKQNYSPNMIAIPKMHKWVYEERKNLSFIFVDYKLVNGKPVILKESALVPIEHIDWDCLTIEAQGFGVIQKPKALKINKSQTKREFYAGFLKAYARFRQKEHDKHEKFARKFISDLETIDW